MTYFNHIIGGYAAGYYSYLWANVLDNDAFEAFKEHGIFDKNTADLFRHNVLEKGDSEDPMVLYRNFRGAEPSLEPLLKNSQNSNMGVPQPSAPQPSAAASDGFMNIPDGLEEELPFS